MSTQLTQMKNTGFKPSATHSDLQTLFVRQYFSFISMIPQPISHTHTAVCSLKNRYLFARNNGQITQQTLPDEVQCVGLSVCMALSRLTKEGSRADSQSECVCVRVYF